MAMANAAFLHNCPLTNHKNIKKRQLGKKLKVGFSGGSGCAHHDITWWNTSCERKADGNPLKITIDLNVIMSILDSAYWLHKVSIKQSSGFIICVLTHWDLPVTGVNASKVHFTHCIFLYLPFLCAGLGLGTGTSWLGFRKDHVLA